MVANGLEMQRIARASEQNNNGMAEMAKQTREDSRAMKVLAVVTMFYLPWTSVAVSSLPHHPFADNRNANDEAQTMFSMQFFEQDDDFHFKHIRRVWMYFAIAVPLTILTFVIWLGYYYWDALHALLLRVPLVVHKSAPAPDPAADGEAVVAEMRRRVLDEERKVEAFRIEIKAKVERYKGMANNSGPDSTEEHDEHMKVLFNEITKDLGEMYERTEKLARDRQVLGLS
jgi:hypothetical protein